MPANEFYELTLAELFDAIIGFNELEQERLQWNLWGVRKQIHYAVLIAGNKDVREEDIFTLEIDDEIRAARIKDMEPIKVTEHGSGE